MWNLLIKVRHPVSTETAKRRRTRQRSDLEKGHSADPSLYRSTYFIHGCHGEMEHRTRTAAAGMTAQEPGPAAAAIGGGESEEARGPREAAAAAAAAGGGARDYGGAAASLRDPACRAGTAEFAAAKAEAQALLQMYRTRKAALDEAGVRLRPAASHDPVFEQEHSCSVVSPACSTVWCCCCPVLCVQQRKSDMVAWKACRVQEPLARRPPSYGHIAGARVGRLTSRATSQRTGCCACAGWVCRRRRKRPPTKRALCHLAHNKASYGAAFVCQGCGHSSGRGWRRQRVTMPREWGSAGISGHHMPTDSRRWWVLPTPPMTPLLPCTCLSMFVAGC